MGWEDSTSVLVVGGLAAGFAILFSLWHVYQHLMHYTEPVFQRYIIRIIFTVPVYAVTSLCSLLDSENAVYYTTVRDVYEAWVIYNFMSLMLAYLVALFALLMFYLATREMLEPHKPLLKFIIVKTIIFLTYWQGFLFQILYSSGAISSVNEAVVLQNFIICLQMAVAAPVMLYAFPFEEYKSGLAGSK
eukprot:jgi/Pico_ML_1/51681/g252.t1